MKSFLLFLSFILLIQATCFQDQVELLEKPSPELQAVIDLYNLSPRFQPCINTEQEIIEQRFGFDFLVPNFLAPYSNLTSVQEVNITLDNNQTVKGYWVWKTGNNLETKRKKGTVLYLHGGAWIVGGFVSQKGIADRLVLELNTVVFFLEYRLAPEIKLPLQLEEIEESYKLIRQSGVKPKKILITGDSAGGHLTALFVQKLRDENKVLPGSIALISPYTEMSGREGESLRTNNDISVAQKNIDPAFVGKWVIGEEYFQTSPVISPFHASWKDLPPTLIISSDREILASEPSLIAQKIRSVNGIVKTLTTPNTMHAYAYYTDSIESRLARAVVKNWFNKYKITLE